MVNCIYGHALPSEESHREVCFGGSVHTLSATLASLLAPSILN